MEAEIEAENNGRSLSTSTTTVDSYERPSLQVKRQLHILFRNKLFHDDCDCFKCLLSTRLSFTYDNTENFLKGRFHYST